MRGKEIKMEGKHLENFVLQDVAILAVYIILVMTTGLFVARNRGETSTDYFLAGRSLNGFAIGTSLFVSHFWILGFCRFSASNASATPSFLHHDGIIIFSLLLLCWFFVPVYLKTPISTISEYFEKRYNSTTRSYLAGFLIIFNVLIRLALTLHIGGSLLNAWLGMNFHTAAVIIVVITGLYTIVAGMRAVAYTAIVQLVFLFGWLGVMVSPGIPGLAGAELNPLVALNFPMNDQLTTRGMLLSLLILGLWFGGGDQFVTQRIFSTKNINHARGATLFAGLLIVVSGLLLASGRTGGTPEIAGPHILPAGLRGLFLAGLLAALMAALSNIFISSATLFTFDFYQKFRPGTSERKQVLIGRLVTTYLVIIAVLGVPLVGIFSQHFWQILIKIPVLFIPPISAVFLFGFLIKRVNCRGAFWAFTIGGLLGLARLIREFIRPADFATVPFLRWFAEIHILKYSVMIFFISGAVLYLGSLWEKVPVCTPQKVPILDISDNFHDFIFYMKTIKQYRVQLIITCVLVIFGITFFFILPNSN